jgi:hypothetical protein
MVETQVHFKPWVNRVQLAQPHREFDSWRTMRPNSFGSPGKRRQGV